MPVSDPSSGRTFIWLITCILFISILAGGGCLVAYMVLPESQITPWIPVVGVALVCLPWAFWLFTFLYRIFSTCCGCSIRAGIANGGGGGVGGRGGAGASNAPGNANVNAVAQENNGAIQRTLSVASHESEIPLARSMAS